MRILLVAFLYAIVTGCGSSSSEITNPGNSNPLLGTWLSNCHEYVGVEGQNEEPVYSISLMTFSDTGYTDSVVAYSDINCTTELSEESFSFNYSTGSAVTTTDGVTATRMTVTPIIPGRPELSIDVEAVFRVSGVELNFGEYTEGEVPAIDYGITYIKQQ